jgi:hypothetical protein
MEARSEPSLNEEDYREPDPEECNHYWITKEIRCGRVTGTEIRCPKCGLTFTDID